MEAAAARSLAHLSRRTMISFVVVVLSCGLTAMMSLLFHRTVRPDMMATGFVAAVIINHVVGRVTRVYRQRLRTAHETLEQRVRERTAELETANTALRTAIATQQELRDELMVRDRMAAAGMVAAGVSHEIRSPLCVIKIAVEEVLEILETAPLAEVRDLVSDIGESSDRIATILRDLSSIARPVDDPIGPVELRGVVDSAVRLASYKLGKGMTLERGATDAPMVCGNASRLVQLVMNLLHNAARATHTDRANTIRIETRNHDDSVVLSISDTGTGMSHETRERLFEPFFTTGRTTGGTGLGMSICRTIVERMGGSIAVESELGRGTTVSVTMPRA
jgi:signal transduction histidine kinase